MTAPGTFTSFAGRGVTQGSKVPGRQHGTFAEAVARFEAEQAEEVLVAA